jgi:catechol 2,3-dioxygenase-like lactoylglutathione lyase family enzyme
MIDHISIGVRDVARTKRFYGAALKPLGSSARARDRSAMVATRSCSGSAAPNIPFPPT